MKELSKPALDHVMDDTISFHPAKFKNSYRNWMENIKDWCISRQLWWGHRIPAWYYGEGDNDFVVAKTEAEALDKAREKSGQADLSTADLKQDEDVMDTWFSSWLWPISVFDGFYSKEEVDYYYPTNDLVTAPEIMFFWVARMIISGYEYRGEKPFSNVYYTGIVRDEQGRKMSKSLGNSPDPIELIEKYGADGVRVGMLLTSPAGNDLPFDVKLCEQGRNFSNKIWNAFRLTTSWEVGEVEQRESAKIAVNWFRERLSQTVSELNNNYDQFRISEALMTTYKLIWDDFCGWYLEMVKPPYGEKIDQLTLEETQNFFKEILVVLHPFMPFISEEIWHYLVDVKKPEEALIVATWPEAMAYDDNILASHKLMTEVVTNIRNIRETKSIPKKTAIEVWIKTNKELDGSADAAIAHLCNVSSIQTCAEKVDNAFSFLLAGNEYFIPFNEEIDVEADREKMQSELDYTRGFLSAVDKKLGNARFVDNAPEQVVLSERKKQQDAIEKIKILEEKLGE
jgi:valyl-tRNA synthetase